MSAVPANFGITQEEWDATPDAAPRCGLTPIQIFALAPAPPARSRRIRCHKEAESWCADMRRETVKLMAEHPTQAEAIQEDMERQIADGPHFARRHRGSEFRKPPKVNTDRNYINKLMFFIEIVERRTWERKDKGKHGGLLGRAAMELFRKLLYFVNKSNGTLFPSYDTLARICKTSRRTVITAMAKLVEMKFVSVFRRCKVIQTPFGRKCVQDSNAYTYHFPPHKGPGSFTWLIFKTTSECKRFAAKLIKDAQSFADKKETQEAPPGSPPPTHQQGVAA